MIRIAVLLFAASLLMAEEAPTRPTARVSVGTFTDSYSDSTGTWKGWTLNGAWFRDDQGPWSFSAVGTQRPEGKGTLFAVAKDHAFGESSWVYASLGTGTGADFVPTFRGNIDLSLGLSGPWSMGLETAWNRFRDGSTTTLLQAGPAWLGEDWSASARVQQLRYQPGRDAETGCLADLRWGTHNLRRWHSLRIGWGRGVIDALQPSGTSYTSTTYSGGGRGNGVGTGITGTTATTVTQTSYPSYKEFLVSTSSHIPITSRLAIRADLAWGQRETQFKVWSGSLQAIVSF
jgi:YaiO family outer membrane protein